MGISVLHSQGRSKVPSNLQQVVSLSGTRSWKLSLYTLQVRSLRERGHRFSNQKIFSWREKTAGDNFTPFSVSIFVLVFSLFNGFFLHYRRQISAGKFRHSGAVQLTIHPQKNEESEPENLLLKIAWYGSEILGVAASLLRYLAKFTEEVVGAGVELAVDGFGKIDRAVMVETIKDDFRRSYFVTGNLATDAYEEDCEFADPAGAFRGLRRFKRNCTNFGYLLERSSMKLMRWEDFEDKGTGHWRFSCVMPFPWKSILSATGYTEYYFDEKSGKVSRHVEHWNVPKMTLLEQILRPSRRLGKNKNS